MNWSVLGAAAMAVGVAAGAFGAHGLKARLDEQAMAWWHTAAQYHFIHALGLFAVDAVARRGASVSLAGWALVVGLVLFSGSLYVMALTGLRWLGAVTPIGGTAWIVGWIALAVAASRA